MTVEVALVLLAAGLFGIALGVFVVVVVVAISSRAQ